MDRFDQFNWPLYKQCVVDKHGHIKFFLNTPLKQFGNAAALGEKREVLKTVCPSKFLTCSHVRFVLNDINWPYPGQPKRIWKSLSVVTGVATGREHPVFWHDWGTLSFIKGHFRPSWWQDSNPEQLIFNVSAMQQTSYFDCISSSVRANQRRFLSDAASLSSDGG